jgi:hypothetical protein
MLLEKRMIREQFEQPVRTKLMLRGYHSILPLIKIACACGFE